LETHLIEKKIEFNNSDFVRSLFGNLNKNQKLLENCYKISIVYRGSCVTLKGREEDVISASTAFKKLYELKNSGIELSHSNILAVTNAALNGKKEMNDSDFLNETIKLNSGKVISAKSQNQKNYINAIKKFDIVIGIGPAGTGKTYLSVAAGIHLLNTKRVSKIILARPAVEAGERLGFLPGDMFEKVNPYLRPLYDALYEMINFEYAARLVEREIIEIAPLAFMRGRTLNNCFIILDEAQNTTSEQMKMFLTRLGSSSKVVVNGDITQIDLPEGKSSGLVEANNLLKHISGIKVIEFNEHDVIRHHLVKEIIKAYENNGTSKNEK